MGHWRICRKNEGGTIDSCYYNTETTKQSKGIGTDNNNQTAPGFNTSQMKQSSNYEGFNFDTVWAIRADSTYPALQKIDNAPFSFRDEFILSYRIADSVDLSFILSNDDDAPYYFAHEYEIFMLDKEKHCYEIDGKVHPCPIY